MKQDMVGSTETVALEKLRELIATKEVSVIHWTDPARERPEEGSYILLKLELGEEGLFCQEGAFEHDRFWDLAPDTPPLEERTVKGWSYPPFDDRLPKAV